MRRARYALEALQAGMGRLAQEVLA